MRASRRIMSDIASNCLTSLAGVFLALLACLALALLLGSCKAGKVITERVEVPVVVTEEHHTESVRVDIVRDTLIQRDSIYHYIKGDTTIIERWHYLQGNSSAIRVDTLIKVDSVQVPVVTERTITEVKEVERKLHWWQKWLMLLGGASLVAGGLWLAWRMGKKKI